MNGLYKFLMSKGQVIALGIGVLSILIVLITIFSGLSSAGYDAGVDLNAILKSGGGDGFNLFNMAIFIPVALCIVALFLWVVYTIVQLVSNPKDSMRMIITFGVVAVLFVILMSMSDSETVGKIKDLLDKNAISEGTSKFISGGIKTTVGLALGAFVVMVIMEILNFFK